MGSARTRTQPRPLLGGIGVVAVALLLAGCGGGEEGAASDDPGEDDARLVEEVVLEHLHSGDPAKCEKLYSDKYLSSNWYSDNADDGLVDCQGQADVSPVPDATVKDVEVDGDSATAIAVYSEDNLGPGLELVKEGDTWVIDASFVAEG